MRPSKLRYWMGIAEAVSAKSHDSETKVGAVMINNETGGVIATGYNGFVRGAPDDELPTQRPAKYAYIVHAEENIMAHCAREGISVNNCTLVITMSPCQRCLRLLWQAGVKEVICKELYRDHNSDMKDLSISEETTDEGYTRLIYKSKSSENNSWLETLYSLGSYFS